MLCSQCGKREATTFLKKTINGQTTEKHLCSECAAKQGIVPSFGKSMFDLGNFWGSFFAPSLQPAEDTVRCEGCGHTFSEMVETGKAGCPACYTTFYDRLLPSIQRIHGKAKHTGKVPPEAGEELQREQEIDKLRRELSECIANQQYEQCAALRDQIRALEETAEEPASQEKGGADHE